MKFFIFLASLVSVTSFGQGWQPKKFMENEKPTKEVVYNVNNTVVLRGPIDSTSVSRTIENIETSRSSEVFLSIYSLGGSVMDGLVLVNYIRSTPKKIICIADVAISTAFIILQACDERLATLSSLTMQHHASFGIRQSEEPNAVNMLKMFTRNTELVNQAQASRLKLSVKKFNELTDRDWWNTAQDNVEKNIVDNMASVSCAPNLFNEVEVQAVRTSFGDFKISWNRCPLVPEPKSVEASNFYSEELQKKSFEILNTYNARAFILQYIQTGIKPTFWGM